MSFFAQSMANEILCYQELNSYLSASSHTYSSTLNVFAKLGLFAIIQPAREARRPSGLHAESARAVSGRRCPHSGKGEDFLTGQPDFFNRNSCNFGTESQQIVPKVGN